MDHILPFARGGETTEENGEGLCEACNYAKEAPGWQHEVAESEDGRALVRITTPTGKTYESAAPPLLPSLGLRTARPPDRDASRGAADRVPA